MIKIEFDHIDYEEMLRHYAAELKGKLKDNMLHLPPEVGEGFIKLIELPNGLQGLVSDYVVTDDLLLKRLKNNKDYYTLRFDEVIVPEDGEVQTGGLEGVRSAVFLGSTRFDWIFMSKAGSRVKGVNILFSKDWLEQFVEVESVGEMIKKYLSLKMSAFNYEPMDMEYKRILNEILQPGVDGDFQSMIVQNRVMLLLERFFTRVYYKMDNMHFNVKMSFDDISRIKMVEKDLLKDFSSEPPSIAALAKKAGMSSSKLKNSFREIYGLPIYQYFQKNRMNKAKAMLLSRKYAVREVGLEVGYSNLSNFAKAFKKAFDQLPSDLF